jgi:hypothetical protein
MSVREGEKIKEKMGDAGAGLAASLEERLAG